MVFCYSKAMRLATLNAQMGGYNSYHDYETRYPPRLEGLQQAVDQLDADVLVVSDTFRWADQFTSADLNKIFGYTSSISVPLNDSRMGRAGQHIGVTMLSRRELWRPEIVQLDGANAIRATVESNLGALSVYGAYFYHGSEDVRVRQAADLLGHAGETSLERTVAAGDFNTAGKNDRLRLPMRHALRLSGLTLASRHFAEAAGTLEGCAHQTLLDNGLLDANLDRVPTFPSKSFRLLGHFVLPRLLRLDHILHAEDVQVDNFRVHTDDLFHAASDHLPVSAQVA